MKSTGNAPDRSSYSSNFEALKMPLKGAYTAENSRQLKCP
jgi:hypothetical protein